MDWAAIRAERRLVVHGAFALPPALYYAPGSVIGTTVTIRLHQKGERHGDLDRQGYAEVVENTVRVVFLTSEVSPERSGTVKLADGRRFKLEFQHQPDDSLFLIWDVEPLTGAAPSAVDYSEAPYHINMVKANRLIVHEAFALPATYYGLDGEPVTITARVHNKGKRFGDLDRDGFAQVVQNVESLIFLLSEVSPERNAVVEFDDGQRFILDFQHPRDDDTIVTWDVIRKSAPSSQTYTVAGYFVDGYTV